MAGTLHIVATPIGNLEDITLRALRVLREADVIAAEDTRVTRKLLSHYDIHTPMIAYHQHSRMKRVGDILNMLQEGKNVALVSDAGTPGISDPGHKLISFCIERAVNVECVPGPAALIAALVLSGMPTAHFAFDGFVPRKEGERAAFFRGLKHDSRTVCLYEAPSRLLRTLKSINSQLGDRMLAVVREATKMFEEVFRGTAAGAIEHFSQGTVRGEIVIVLHGASPEEVAENRVPEIGLESCLLELIASGLSQRDAVSRCAAEFNLPKRRVYAAALKLQKG